MFRPDGSDSGSLRPESPTTDLLSVVSDCNLQIAFQPITDLHRARVVGLEALARPPADSTMRSAEELFSRADAMGITPALDACARRAILDACMPLPQGVLLFINVSAQTLADRHAVRDLCADMARVLDPSRVVVEITETGGHEDLIGAAVEMLRDAGFSIALDDLGSGHADLRRLVDLRPEWIKLDRSLTHRIHRDPARARLVASLLTYAGGCPARVIAEGVERPGELTCLRGLGVRFIQGYLLARPSRSHDAARRVAEGRLTRLAA